MKIDIRSERKRRDNGTNETLSVCVNAHFNVKYIDSNNYINTPKAHEIK